MIRPRALKQLHLDESRRDGLDAQRERTQGRTAGSSANALFMLPFIPRHSLFIVKKSHNPVHYTGKISASITNMLMS